MDSGDIASGARVSQEDCVTVTHALDTSDGTLQLRMNLVEHLNIGGRQSIVWAVALKVVGFKTRFRTNIKRERPLAFEVRTTMGEIVFRGK